MYCHSPGSTMDATDSASGGTTMGATAITSADPALLEWLARHDVEYEVHPHAQAFTALGVAKAEGVDPHTVAKVVAVTTLDGHKALIVLETTDRLDLRKAARILQADSVRLLTEAELATLAPTCEIGAMPAVGPLFGVDMVADHAIHDDSDISFNAGSHRCSVRVERAGWERATGVTYADLAADRGDRPAWERS
jgi:Ala-tRNA(Pro) deacylase